MVTSVRWKWFLLPVLGVALLAAGVVQVDGGKPPQPTPPPVLYNIQFWNMPAANTGWSIQKMNNLGQTVGSFITPAGEERAFLYDPTLNPNVAVDLNQIGITNVPPGMVIGRAKHINDSGVIVGSLGQAGTQMGNSPVLQGFVLDTIKSPTTLALPAAPHGSTLWSCARINNLGDILVGEYIDPPSNARLTIYRWDGSVIDQGVVTSYLTGCHMNDALQVAGNFFIGGTLSPYRWNATQNTFDPSPQAANDFNGSGWVCGTTMTQSHTTYYPFRYDFTNPLQVLSGLKNGGALAINSNGDLFCRAATNGGNSYAIYVYQDTSAKFYSVDSLIDPSDPDAAAWSSKSSAQAADMTDRIGTTNFGEVVGSVTLKDGSQLGYLLTPRLP